jgi:hypothetical protein
MRLRMWQALFFSPYWEALKSWQVERWVSENGESAPVVSIGLQRIGRRRLQSSQRGRQGLPLVHFSPLPDPCFSLIPCTHTTCLADSAHVKPNSGRE